jgi:hypothetical protein
MVVASGFNAVLFFISAVEEHNAVRYTHLVKYVPHVISFQSVTQTTEVKSPPIQHVT